MAETTLDDDANARDGGADASGDDREPSPRWITRRRLAKWNRPAPPHDWRWAVSTLGRVLIATGVLLFGFVAYQLWGTGLETARAQRSLAQEFDEMLAATPSPPTATPPPDTAPPDDATDDDADPPPRPDPDDTGPDDTGNDDTGPDDTGPDDTGPDDTGPDDTGNEGGDGDGTEGDTDTSDDETGSDDTSDDDTSDDDGAAEGADPAPTTPPPPESERGEPVARIEIPAIGVDEIVVAGVRPNDLQKGPGHFPRTPFPGQLGNAAIAGHRTTYGAPFRRVDQLQPGDEIVVRTVQGGFAYLVTGTEIVAPQDGHVVATTDPDVASLTLVSCHPVYSAAQRIIITAEMDLTRSIPFPATIPDGDTADEPADLPSEDLTDDASDQPDDTDDGATDDDTGDDDTNDDTGDDDTGDDDTGDDDTNDDTGDDGAAERDTADDTGSIDDDTAGGNDGADDDTGDDTGRDTGDTGSPADQESPDDPAGIDAGSADGGTGAAAADVASPTVDDELDDAFGRGWFHDRDAFGQIALWGVLLTIVSIGAYLLSRVTRRDLVGFAAGVAPFAISAFFFFQNVNRLLPPGL